MTSKRQSSYILSSRRKEHGQNTIQGIYLSLGNLYQERSIIGINSTLLPQISCGTPSRDAYDVDFFVTAAIIYTVYI